MCQGAIVSIVRFGKKRVVLSGIGSHSTLIADNEAKATAFIKIFRNPKNRIIK